MYFYVFDMYSKCFRSKNTRATYGIVLVFVARNIIKFLRGKRGKEGKRREKKRGKRERQVGVLIT